MNLVIDTNVLVSALVFNSDPLSWMPSLWRSGEITPLASRETTAELLRVLSYPKFGLDAVDRDDLLADYLPWCVIITVPGGIDVPHCRDPNDRPFLELAVVASADAIVTGDADLLAMSSVFTIPILSPAELQGRIPHIG